MSHPDRFPWDHLSQAEIREFEKLLPYAAGGFVRGIPPAERPARAQRFRELLARRYSPPKTDPDEAA